MTQYLVSDETIANLQSTLGTLFREAIESGLSDYAEHIRVLLAQLTSVPVQTPEVAKTELSQGWEVSMSYETADGAVPYVTDRDLVVGAVAELVGADLADSSVTIEELDGMVEEIDAAYGAYMIPLKPEHVEQAAAGATEFLVSHPMGGLIYITIAQV